VSASRADGSRVAGTVSLLGGVVALAALMWVWVLSATPLDPPGWLRVLGSTFLPVGLALATGAGLAGLRGPGRVPALTGLALAAATVLGLVVLLNAHG
jgi:hypothetical protein